MENKASCPVEATLELIGGKYKALILWHLSGGTLRFSELRKVISATPKMLTQQLRELEAQHLINREVFPVIPPKVEYSLTETGKSLLPILVTIFSMNRFPRENDRTGMTWFSYGLARLWWHSSIRRVLR